MYLADFHLHSTFSDGKLSIAELVDLYGELGFGAIAITDHICETNGLFGIGAKYLKWTVQQENFTKYISEIHEQAERARKQYGMVVIPGYEITKNSIFPSQSAHILVIGSEKFICANQDIRTSLQVAKNHGALTVAAHPVDTGIKEKQTFQLWNMREEIKSDVDAWEVASGPIWFEQVAESGLPMLASSDLHHPSQIQSWKTVFSCERHPEAIMNAIRNQDIEFKFYRVNECVVRRMSASLDLPAIFGT